VYILTQFPLEMLPGFLVLLARNIIPTLFVQTSTAPVFPGPFKVIINRTRRIIQSQLVHILTQLPLEMLLGSLFRHARNITPTLFVRTTTDPVLPVILATQIEFPMTTWIIITELGPPTTNHAVVGSIFRSATRLSRTLGG
jgi:hypothetical protein